MTDHPGKRRPIAKRLWLAGVALGMMAVGPAQAAPLPAGARYVAMGSSFAAGPGVTQSADTPPNRCTRSRDNYAHQLARLRRLDLVDVSCGGATSAHVLSGWNELPPQVDALTADTRLVTVTIGGNDVRYVGGLIAASCPPGASMLPGRAMRCGSAPLASDAEWTTVEARLTDIALAVRQRAPEAILVFVEYLELLPARGGCAVTPLSAADATRARVTAARLAALTDAVARKTKAKVVRAGFSRGHDACAAEPWVNGFPPAGTTPAGTVPYHPNLAGMTAVAKALDKML